MQPTDKLKQSTIAYKSGNTDAFTTLYEESSKYIYTCIYKVMSGNDNATDTINDIMQDTYVEISKSIAQLENEDKFLSWAGTIATRKCYAYLKKNKKYVLLNEEDTTFETLSDSENIIPEEVMQSKEKQRLVREIIEKELTEMQKLCIIAYYFNEQKQSEIAQELGIPENTVKTNLSRAKAKIKEGVLTLEKREGTKLYTPAPLLLLLFTEDVQAAIVPKEIAKGVISAASISASEAGTSVAATSTVKSTKGLIGKIATASTKTKIISAVAGVAITGATGGILYTRDKPDTEYLAKVAANAHLWQDIYKDHLLSLDDALGFDLNDFDKDGIPEILVSEENTYTTVYRLHNQQIELVESIQGQMFSDLPDAIEEWYECKLGYGVQADELVKLDYAIGTRLDTGKEYTTRSRFYLKYEDGAFSRHSSIKDGKKAEKEYNEIKFSDLNAEDVEERFAEFLERGNRPRRKKLF